MDAKELSETLRKRLFDKEERIRRLQEKQRLQNAEIETMNTEITYHEKKEHLRELKARNNPVLRMFGSLGSAYRKEVERRRAK